MIFVWVLQVFTNKCSELDCSIQSASGQIAQAMMSMKPKNKCAKPPAKLDCANECEAPGPQGPTDSLARALASMIPQKDQKESEEPCPGKSPKKGNREIECMTGPKVDCATKSRGSAETALMSALTEQTQAVIAEQQKKAEKPELECKNPVKGSIGNACEQAKQVQQIADVIQQQTECQQKSEPQPKAQDCSSMPNTASMPGAVSQAGQQSDCGSSGCLNPPPPTECASGTGAPPTRPESSLGKADFSCTDQKPPTVVSSECESSPKSGLGGSSLPQGMAECGSSPECSAGKPSSLPSGGSSDCGSSSPGSSSGSPSSECADSNPPSCDSNSPSAGSSPFSTLNCTTVLNPGTNGPSQPDCTMFPPDKFEPSAAQPAFPKSQNTSCEEPTSIEVPVQSPGGGGPGDSCGDSPSGSSSPSTGSPAECQPPPESQQPCIPQTINPVQMIKETIEKLAQHKYKSATPPPVPKKQSPSSSQSPTPIDGSNLENLSEVQKMCCKSDGECPCTPVINIYPVIYK